MNSLSLSHKNNLHRKLIDIPEDVFSTLSIRAAAVGMNLKKYIEHLLVLEAEELDDEALYAYMVQNKPEGEMILGSKAKDEFMQRHKLGKYR